MVGIAVVTMVYRKENPISAVFFFLRVTIGQLTTSRAARNTAIYIYMRTSASGSNFISPLPREKGGWLKSLHISHS